MTDFDSFQDLDSIVRPPSVLKIPTYKRREMGLGSEVPVNKNLCTIKGYLNSDVVGLQNEKREYCVLQGKILFSLEDENVSHHQRQIE